MATARAKVQVLTLRCRFCRDGRKAVDSKARLAQNYTIPPQRPRRIMPLADLITKKLTDAFAPEAIRVANESNLHEGHAGHRPGGETHFRVYIVATAFEGKSRIERHRMVNTALAEELAGGIHALAIKAHAPGETQR